MTYPQDIFRKQERRTAEVKRREREMYLRRFGFQCKACAGTGMVSGSRGGQTSCHRCRRRKEKIRRRRPFGSRPGAHGG
jgi:hypothetical protein